MGDRKKYQKIKKAKALEEFIEAMEQKRAEIEEEVHRDKADKANEVLKRHLVTLDKQIKKARKILEDIA